MGYLPGTMELTLYIMFSACLGREKHEGVGHCDLVNNRKKPGQSWQAHNIKTFYRFLHAAIFWWEGHFQWVVIATVRGSWLAGRWRVWGPLLMEGKEKKTPILIIISFLLDIHCVSFSLSLLRFCICVWLCGIIGVSHSNLLTLKVGVKTINNSTTVRSDCWFAVYINPNVHQLFII